MNSTEDTQARSQSWKKSFKTKLLVLGISLFLLGIAFDSFYYEPTHPKTEFHQFPTKKLKTGQKPLRVIHLSDLHIKTFGKTEQLIVQKVNQQKPDVIALTGDYVDDSQNLPALKKFLGALPSSALKFAVLGNIDHLIGVQPQEFEKIFSEFGFQLLLNSRVKLQIHSISICVIGFDDPSTGRYDLRAIENLSRSDFNLLLAHSPEIYHLIQKGKIDLVLSGHTHGGQIHIPGIPAFWLPRDTRKYGTGFYKKGKPVMYVNRGIGTSVLPARFLCPPETAVFDIVPAK